MKEIYVVTFNGSLAITPYSGQYGIDKELVAELRDDNFSNLVPFTTQGDPELIHCTVFQNRKTSGGVIVVYNDDTVEPAPLFCAIARSSLELTEGASHFSEVVANIRYGKDIFESKTEE